MITIEKHCSIADHRVMINGVEVLAADNNAGFTDFIKQVYKHYNFNYAKFFKMDNLSKLGFAAAEILLEGVDLTGVDKSKVGIFLSNAASSLDTDIVHQESIRDKENYFPSPSIFVYTLPNIVIGEICIKHKIMGETAFFVSDTFDAEFMYNYIHELFSTDKITHCITGWVELEGEQYRSSLCLVKKGAENGSVLHKNTIFDIESFEDLMF